MSIRTWTPSPRPRSSPRTMAHRMAEMPRGRYCRRPIPAPTISMETSSNSCATTSSMRGTTSRRPSRNTRKTTLDSRSAAQLHSKIAPRQNRNLLLLFRRVAPGRWCPATSSPRRYPRTRNAPATHRPMPCGWHAVWLDHGPGISDLPIVYSIAYGHESKCGPELLPEQSGPRRPERPGAAGVDSGRDIRLRNLLAFQASPAQFTTNREELFRIDEVVNDKLRGFGSSLTHGPP